MADQTRPSPVAPPFGVATNPQKVLVVYTYYQYPFDTPVRSEMNCIQPHDVKTQHYCHIVTVDDEPWSSEKNEAWFQDLKQRIESTPRRCHREPATIFRVPKNIREADPKAYEPRIVSLGPYHRGKPHLETLEQLKYDYARDFLTRRPSGGLYEHLIKSLKSVETQARNAYSNEPEMNSNEFVKMLLLDGCFVLELCLKRYEAGRGGETVYDDPFVGNEWALPLVMVDMLMLENQLPFFVLQLLYKTVPVKIELEELAFLCLKFDGAFLMHKNAFSEGSTFHHLLHLFHSCVLSVAPEECRRARRFHTLSSTFTYAKSLLSDLGRRTSVSSFGNLRIWGFFPRRKPQQDEQLSISCATKLKEAGIKFRRKTNTKSTLDVTFKDGHLEMPQIGLSDNTNYLLRNMIAFEQCYTEVGDDVSAYAVLMDSIIDTPGDVALLQCNGVLVNCLSDDDDAARLFNGLCREVSAGFEDTYLFGLAKDVNKHCSSKLNRWRAKLNHDYFNNPWSAVSVCGAIVLLFLTLVQTIFSIIQYHHPGQ